MDLITLDPSKIYKDSLERPMIFNSLFKDEISKYTQNDEGPHISFRKIKLALKAVYLSKSHITKMFEFLFMYISNQHASHF